MQEEEDGHFLFVSRVKDLIVRGGSNISPVEVEQILTAHPAVRDAGIVGAPDRLLGQKVVGFVQLAPAPYVRRKELLANGVLLRRSQTIRPLHH